MIRGSCPEGQACYSFEDPFEEEFFCIPDDICGASLATANERLAWERASRERSEALRAKFQRRMDRRTGKPTSPPAEPEQENAPGSVELPGAESASGRRPAGRSGYEAGTTDDEAENSSPLFVS